MNAPASLAAWKDLFSDWLFNAALPLWSENGADHRQGGFFEVLNRDGAAPVIPRRARVQARQSFVFSFAARLGWKGPGIEAAEHGLSYLQARYRKPDGLLRNLVGPDGSAMAEEAMTYDQAFGLLAAASLYAARPAADEAKSFAYGLARCLRECRHHAKGGFWEEGPQRFLSNPQMHLLEAALAWIEVDDDPIWQDMADELAVLALTKLIDPDRNILSEYFDDAWRPLPGPLGEIVEPGHQFEWAWLLERWSRLRGRKDAHQAARALFDAGVRGCDPARHVAMDRMSRTFAPLSRAARLWPQTERLKASLLLAQKAEGEARQTYENEARAAAQGLWGYLDTPLKGLWRDKMEPDGAYIEEPAPASSLYHIICAVAALRGEYQ